MPASFLAAFRAVPAAALEDDLSGLVTTSTLQRGRGMARFWITPLTVPDLMPRIGGPNLHEAAGAVA